MHVCVITGGGPSEVHFEMRSQRVDPTVDHLGVRNTSFLCAVTGICFPCDYPEFYDRRWRSQGFASRLMEHQNMELWFNDGYYGAGRSTFYGRDATSAGTLCERRTEAQLTLVPGRDELAFRDMPAYYLNQEGIINNP